MKVAWMLLQRWVGTALLLPVLFCGRVRCLVGRGGAMRAVRAGVLLAAVLAIVAPLVVTDRAFAASPHAVPFQRGVTIADWGTNAYAGTGYGKLVTSLKARGVNTVTLLVVWKQDTTDSVTITPDSNTVPTARLVQAINTAHAAGLRVILRPYIGVRTGTWRGLITPSSVAQWFASYDAFIVRYAKLAHKQHVQGFVVGSEMQSMAHYANQWRALVHQVRHVFPTGFVAYQANHNEVYQHNVTWWDAVDVIDFSAYFALNKSGKFDVPDLIRGWSRWYSLLDRLHRKYHRNVMFGELGYTPYTGTFAMAQFTGPLGRYSPTAQANGYTAAFRVWYQAPFFKGFEWWYVSSNPALRTTRSGNDEPRPPALKVLRDWYLSTKHAGS